MESGGFDLKAYLFTHNLRPNGGLEHQVLEYGGERCDPYSSSNKNRHLKVVPLLMALTEWSIQVELQIEESSMITVTKGQKLKLHLTDVLLGRPQAPGGSPRCRAL